MPKAKVGYMKCETRKCANGDGGAGRVSVMENDKGTRSYNCDECGSTPYCRPGSKQFAAWDRDMEKVPGAAVLPAPEKKPEPKPAPKKEPEKKPAPAATAPARADW